MADLPAAVQARLVGELLARRLVGYIRERMVGSMRRILIAALSALSALIAIVALAGGYALAQAANADSVSAHGWITFKAAEDGAYSLNSAQTNWAFGSPAGGTGITCTNQAPCADHGYTSLYRTASYAQFQSDISSGLLAGYKYAVYDIEDGNGTPANESAAAPTYMADFNALAVANGLIPIITPARDLMNVSSSWCSASGTLDQKSLKCKLWGKAAVNMPGNGSGIVVIQTQVDTTNLANFKTLYSGGASEIGTKAQAWDEISCNYGTDAQRVTALESEPSAPGAYFSFSASMASHAISDWASLQAANW